MDRAPVYMDKDLQINTWRGLYRWESFGDRIVSDTVDIQDKFF
jgi:hypothetical protein